MADDEKPAETPPTPDLSAKVAELQAKLDREAQQNEMLQRTLSALGGAPRSEAASQQTAAAVGSRLDRLRAKGWTDDQIADVREIIAENIEPILHRADSVLAGFGDKLDLHDLLVEEPGDARKFRKEIDAEIQQRRQSGQMVPPRKELLQVVKARHLPELIAEETAKKAEEEKARAASAASATTEGTVHAGQAKPSPSPTSAPKKALTREDIEAIPDRAERIKAIEEAAADARIP